MEYTGPMLKPQKAKPTGSVETTTVTERPERRGGGTVYKILKELIDNKIKLLEQQRITDEKAKAASRSGSGFTKLQR